MKETQKTQSHPKSRDFDDYLIKSLKDDPELASEYLNAAMEDGDIRVFLLALGQVTKARGMSAISKKTGLNRENIYRIVSTKGNPQIKSVFALLDAVGLKLKTFPRFRGTWPRPFTAWLEIASEFPPVSTGLPVR